MLAGQCSMPNAQCPMLHAKQDFRSVLVVDERRTVVRRGQPVALTRQEFDVLERLTARPGLVLRRAALLQAVWKNDARVTTRTRRCRRQPTAAHRCNDGFHSRAPLEDE